MITQKALDFLAENRFRNSKAWYDEHRPEYVKYVVEPLAALVCELTETMQSIDSDIVCSPKIGGSISRVRRDTRYSNDKSMYRRNAWIVFGRKDRLRECLPSFYMDMSQEGFVYGCGYYWCSADTAQTVRELILDGDPAFGAAVKAYEKQSVFTFGGESSKRRHYPDEVGARAEWLEKRSYDFHRFSTDFDLLFSPDLGKRLAEDFKLLAPIYGFFLKAASHTSHRDVMRRESFEF